MSDAGSEAKPTGLRPFIPAADFEKSRRFYEAIGFTVEFSDNEIAVMQSGAARFILQNFFEKSLAENLMLQLAVVDADAWWSEYKPEQIAREFQIRDPKPPAIQSWGRKVGFVIDPSGVLWHIAELG